MRKCHVKTTCCRRHFKTWGRLGCRTCDFVNFTLPVRLPAVKVSRMASLRIALTMTVILFLCSLGGQSRADETEEVEELKTEVLFKPEKCDKVTKRHDMVSMHYTGTLTATGAKFDSSHDRNQPFLFQLGVGQVIQGWEQGLLDMCIGEKRKLVIPPHLGYGDQGAGEQIPPKSSLTFEVELMDIQDGTPPQNVFKEIDANEDQLLSKQEISDFLKEQSKKGPEPGLLDEQHDTVINEIFSHEDKDKDGFISHEEFSGPKHDEL